MHPATLHPLAASRIRELITEAGDARRAHEARRARRWTPPRPVHVYVIEPERPEHGAHSPAGSTHRQPSLSG